ncbi:OLC1v1019296C1 [Oldenlandia corymbosa var. corymbosa]|uniref:OLC1v1019296C1 n=1 Tax=Oldenlandia corymbosa var. corymbosa TaxID=529605 RepID=A0AAV1EE10_OLDCO|nr:OLC1v1019296C1 [Oldenlandia corymbosa var. corymbosa]
MHKQITAELIFPFTDSNVFQDHGFHRRGYQLKQCSVSSLLYAATAVLSDIDYPLKSSDKSVSVVGSCFGLVCISFDTGKDLFLWNPCTKRSKNLHDSYMERKKCRFDLLGFGYDEVNYDYKAVRIRVKLGAPFFGGGRLPYVTEVRVYSLKNDSWSRIRLCEDVVPSWGSGYFAGGNLHWVVATSGADSWKFLSFDLASETYGEIEWPRSKDHLDDWSAGVLGGCLCVLYDYEKIDVDVWVMKEYGVKDS